MRFWIPYLASASSAAQPPGISWRVEILFQRFQFSKKNSDSFAIVSEILILGVSFAEPG